MRRSAGCWQMAAAAQAAAGIGMAAASAWTIELLRMAQQQFAFVRRARARIAANILFDHGKPVDDMAERAVHGVERILRAGDIVLEIVDAGRCVRARAAVLVRFDMHQKIGEAAFERFQMAEARNRRRPASPPA